MGSLRISAFHHPKVAQQLAIKMLSDVFLAEARLLNEKFVSWQKKKRDPSDDMTERKLQEWGPVIERSLGHLVSTRPFDFILETMKKIAEFEQDWQKAFLVGEEDIRLKARQILQLQNLISLYPPVEVARIIRVGLEEYRNHLKGARTAMAWSGAVAVAATEEVSLPIDIKFFELMIEMLES